MELTERLEALKAHVDSIPEPDRQLLEKKGFWFLVGYMAGPMLEEAIDSTLRYLKTQEARQG